MMTKGIIIYVKDKNLFFPFLNLDISYSETIANIINNVLHVISEYLVPNHIISIYIMPERILLMGSCILPSKIFDLESML